MRHLIIPTLFIITLGFNMALAQEENRSEFTQRIKLEKSEQGQKMNEACMIFEKYDQVRSYGQCQKAKREAFFENSSISKYAFKMCLGTDSDIDSQTQCLEILGESSPDEAVKIVFEECQDRHFSLFSSETDTRKKFQCYRSSLLTIGV